MTRKASLLLLLPGLMFGCEENNEAVTPAPAGEVVPAPATPGAVAPADNAELRAVIVPLEQQAGAMRAQAAQFNERIVLVPVESRTTLATSMERFDEQINTAQQKITQLRDYRGTDWQDKVEEVREELNQAQQTLGEIERELNAAANQPPAQPIDPSTEPGSNPPQPPEPSEPPSPPGTGEPPSSPGT